MDASARLLVKVAYLYYVCQQRQETIAQALNLSRSTVSRMLMDARERGLVEIKINYGAQTNIDLERRLEELFGLHEAIVVPDALNLPEGVGQQVASAAASYLIRVLRRGGILGVSGGSTLAQVARSLRGLASIDLTVVQLIGQTGFGDGSLTGVLSGYEIVRSFADALDARYQLLIAPAIAEQSEIGQALRAEPMVQQTLEMARQANVVLVGIGALGPMNDLVLAGSLTIDDMDHLAANGVVGEVCARFFDINGQPAGGVYERRVTGLDLDDLRACPLVSAVAHGRAKAASILGALRGGFIKVFVTDEETALAVLQLAGVDRASNEGLVMTGA